MKVVWRTMSWAVALAVVQGPAWAEHPAVVEKKNVPLEEVRKRIPCEFFQPDFLIGDGLGWHDRRDRRSHSSTQENPRSRPCLPCRSHLGLGLGKYSS